MMWNQTSIQNTFLRSLTNIIDERGSFTEIMRENQLPEDIKFVQSNISVSKQNVLRGMHFQESQWQMVTLIHGQILDVIFDVRMESKTYGMGLSFYLQDNKEQLLIPPGVAHGFLVLSTEAIINYHTSKYYLETRESGIKWNSKEIREFWPSGEFLVSPRDKNLPIFKK